MSIDINVIFTIVGTIVSIGFVYGTLRTQVKALRNEVEALKLTNSRIIAVESKVDILINHFIK